MTDWIVTEDGFVDEGGNFMQASCHHRPARGMATKLSACGGCYARATSALQRLSDEGNHLAAEVLEAQRAEGKRCRCKCRRVAGDNIHCEIHGEGVRHD